MENYEKSDVNLSGLGDATLLDIATDPEMNDQLSNQAGEEIKRRQAEGTFDETLPESESEEEYDEDNYSEYEQRMEKIGERAFRRHEDLNSKAYARKQSELDKQERGHSLKHYEVDRDMSDALARTEGPTKETAPRGDIEILEKAERQIRNNAKRFATEGFATALYDGVDTTASDAILNGYARQLWKVRMTNPEYGSAYETMGLMHKIESDIIPQYAEKLDDAAVAEARREAYISAIHQGVLYEQDPDGQMTYRYTIPEKVVTSPAELSGQVKKFVDRYGEQYNPTTTSSERFLAENGIELDSDEIREQSYTGFRNIVDAIKDEETPDTTQLEWYYQNLHYGEHIGDLYIAMQRYAEGDEKARKVIKSFLEGKTEFIEWQQQNAIKEDSETLADSDYKPTNLDEEDVPETIDLSTIGDSTRKAIDYLTRQWGIQATDIDPKIIAHIDRSGFMYDLIHRQKDDREAIEPISSVEEARKREIENANKPYTGEKSSGDSKSDKKYAKREIWTKEEKEILVKAKILTLHYVCQRLHDTGVDPNAEVLEPIKLSSCNYILLRFGCDGKNHVIGESPDSDEASMYIWYGDGDGYKQVFSSGITKKQAKAMDGVRAFPHVGGFEGLHGVHDKALDYFIANGALSVENKQKINNTYEAA